MPRYGYIIAFVIVLGVSAGFSQVDLNEKPNIVIVSLESIPTNRMPCYGYERNTTPNLCKFAEEEATLYKRFYSTGGFTSLSLSSLATGKYPSEIGISKSWGRIPKDEPTLAEELQNAGYDTYGINLEGVPVTNLERGYQERFEPISPSRRLENSDIFEKSEKPFLVRIHIWQTHSPYASPLLEKRNQNNRSLRYIEGLKYNYTPAKVTQRKDDKANIPEKHVSNLYDENLRAVDEDVYGEVLEELKESEEYDDTLIIIFGDHGELLGKDNIWGHGKPSHYDELLNTPLIVKYPEQDESRVSDRLSTTVDLHQTVLNHAGIRSESSGTPLSVTRTDPVISYSAGQYTIINRSHKATVCERRGRLTFCSDQEPFYQYNEGEFNPLNQTESLSDLIEQLESRLKDSKRDSDSEPLSEHRERLEKLGYLAGES